MTIQEEIEKLKSKVKHMKAVLNNARINRKWNKMDRCHYYIFSVEAIIKIMKEHNISEWEAWKILDKKALASSARSLK